MLYIYQYVNGEEERISRITRRLPKQSGELRRLGAAEIPWHRTNNRFHWPKLRIGIYCQ